MNNTFHLDGREYSYDALSPNARAIVDAIQEANSRIAPLQRDVFIYSMAVDRLLATLRGVMAEESEAIGVTEAQ